LGCGPLSCRHYIEEVGAQRHAGQESRPYSHQPTDRGGAGSDGKPAAPEPHIYTARRCLCAASIDERDRAGTLDGHTMEAARYSSWQGSSPTRSATTRSEVSNRRTPARAPAVVKAREPMEAITVTAVGVASFSCCGWLLATCQCRGGQLYSGRRES